jgi:putative glutamine transport system permease protein
MRRHAATAPTRAGIREEERMDLFDPMRWQQTLANMDMFWEGFGFTLRVVLAGLALALVLGTVLGIFSTTRSKVLHAINRVYVEFYQNTPLPVQVFFMYAAGPLILQRVTGASDPVRIASFTLGTLGVGLYHAAYISEVIRQGIEAVPRGQMEAALSQGFSRAQAYRYVILPQTFRIILPPLCNQALNLVKNTSVLALIAGGDLMYNADNFVSTYGYLQGYVMCCLLYFLICFPLALLVQHLERSSSRTPRRRRRAVAAQAGHAAGGEA